MRLPVSLALVLPALACATALPRAAPGEAPIDRSLRVEVVYTGEENRETYLEELQARLLGSLAADACFRSVTTGGEADLVLTVGIERLEISEEKRFTGPTTGGPGSIVLVDATVVIGGTIGLATADGREVLEPRRFLRTVREEPVTPLDEPTARALDRAFREPEVWVYKHLCRKREALRKRLQRAGPPAP